MKIGLVIYGSLDTVTGGFVYDRKLVEHLRSSGDTVEVFSVPWRTYSRHLMDNVSGSLFRTLQEARLDLLLQDELNHPSLFLLNRRLRNISYPIVSVVHHLRCSEQRPAWQNRLYSIVERRYLETVDGFVFNSNTTHDSVRNLIGTEKPSVTVYPGRPPGSALMTQEEVAARAMEDGPLRILTVGNLIPRKNVHTLLAGLARLPEDSWRLEVVGSLESDPEYVAQVRALVESNNLSGRVKLLGTITGEQLSERYRYNQFLAAPSTYEGFGIVYLEGKCYGLPALASTTGAAHEVVAHESDGILVNPFDPETMAEHILALHRDRNRLIRMSLHALERYESYPTWEAGAARIRSFLQDMVIGR